MGHSRGTLKPLRDPLPRPLTRRYIGALLAVATLLLAGQLVVQRALDRQQGDARVINVAGRQRMLSQRLCMLLLARSSNGDAAGDLEREIQHVANEWQTTQATLRARPNSSQVAHLFEQISGDHEAMLAAASALDLSGAARVAQLHQQAFLDGMDGIVSAYEREARARVVTLRYMELALFGLAVVVLLLEGMFVFRPAVRAIGAYLRQRDRAEREIVKVSDREQQQLARDLHDGLSQQLVGIAMAVKSMRADEPPEPALLQEVRRLLSDAVDQTRGLARGLYSVALDADGLAAALRDLAVQTERRHAVTCRAELVDVAEPSQEVCGHLYRIAREAVVNAVKHAECKTITIELSQSPSSLVLAVGDDGVGIQPGASDGLGLHMMEYRAKMIGAALAVSAGEQGGTRVTCRLPS